jgi:hypothetical protein
MSVTQKHIMNVTQISQINTESCVAQLYLCKSVKSV